MILEEVLLHGLVSSGTLRVSDSPRHDLLPCDGVAALITAAPPGIRAFGAEAMADLALRHHAVLQAYCVYGTVLPMRFGAAFSSTEAVQQHVAQTSEQMQSAIRTLDNLKEYTIRLTVTGDPVQPQRAVLSGRDFLARGRDQRDLRHKISERRATLSRNLADALHQIAAQLEPASASRPDRVFDVAVLLRRDATSALATLAKRIGPEARVLGLDLRVTGPWPAYSFKLPEPEMCHGG